MLTLHFTAADLTDVTVASGLDPLWEVALGASALRAARPPRALRTWAGAARGALEPTMRPLLELVPTGGGFPDFLTPEFASGPLPHRVADLLDVETARLRDEVPESSAWTARLARGEVAARRELGAAVVAFHAAALAPIQGQREQWLVAERARYTDLLAGAGLAGLLGGLIPGMRWDPPRLTFVTDPPGPHTLHVDLNGRGLTVYPSRFLGSGPLVLDVPDQRPVLVVPAAAEMIDAAGGLTDLMGRTRAVVLTTLVAPASTSQLAKRAGISVASASEHAGVLRGAGLVSTQRIRGSVLHTLTPLGRRLLVESGALAPDAEGVG